MVVARPFGLQLRAAGGSETVRANAAVGVRQPPLSPHPALPEHLLQRGVERSFLDPQHLAGDPADPLRDRIAVERSRVQHAQHEKNQGSGNELSLGLGSGDICIVYLCLARSSRSYEDSCDRFNNYRFTYIRDSGGAPALRSPHRFAIARRQCPTPVKLFVPHLLIASRGPAGPGVRVLLHRSGFGPSTFHGRVLPRRLKRVKSLVITVIVIFLIIGAGLTLPALGGLCRQPTATGQDDAGQIHPEA